jgi:hypothetical protein
MAFMASAQDFLQPDARHCLAKFFDFSEHPLDFGPTLTPFRHDAGDRFSALGDDDCLAALDCGEHVGQVCTNFRRVKFLHGEALLPQ